MTRGEKARFWLRRIFGVALGLGARFAKRPAVREGLGAGRDILEELDQSSLVDEPVTPPATPKAKRHSGVR